MLFQKQGLGRTVSGEGVLEARRGVYPGLCICARTRCFRRRRLLATRPKKTECWVIFGKAGLKSVLPIDGCGMIVPYAGQFIGSRANLSEQATLWFASQTWPFLVWNAAKKNTRSWQGKVLHCLSKPHVYTKRQDHVHHEFNKKKESRLGNR